MRSSGSGSEKQYLDFENYRHITFKWHFKLTKSLVICLESKDYIQIRNGLILLTKVCIVYVHIQCLCAHVLQNITILTYSKMNTHLTYNVHVKHTCINACTVSNIVIHTHC